VTFQQVLAASQLVEPHLELVVFLPEGVDVADRHANGSLVRLAQLVHLLLILPLTSADCARPELDELNVLGPNPAGILVEADVVDDEFVSPRDGLAGIAAAVVEVISATDVVQILGPQVHVQRCH